MQLTACDSNFAAGAINARDRLQISKNIGPLSLKAGNQLRSGLAWDGAVKQLSKSTKLTPFVKHRISEGKSSTFTNAGLIRHNRLLHPMTEDGFLRRTESPAYARFDSQI